MDLTDRKTYLDLRARYLRLVEALRRTREHNPETLEAMERVIPPESLDQSAQGQSAGAMARARSESEDRNRARDAA